MPIKGFSTQSRIGKESFVTIQDVGGGRRALDTIQYGISEVPGSLTIASLSSYNVGIVAHGATENDFLKINGIIYVISEVIDVDNVKLTEIPVANVADSVSVMKMVQLSLAADGSLIVTSGPVRFVRDGISTEVQIDTSFPANTRALPVELVAASGDINVTAGDINVQLSHNAANPDSTRIGDGTTELGIKPVTKEALVHDADGLVELQAILAKILATPSTEAKQDSVITALGSLLTEMQLKANLLETQPVSAASLPLPSGAATETKQSSILASLGDTLTELRLKADLTETQPVSLASAPLPAGSATEAKQDAAITAIGTLLAELQAKADLIETQPVSLVSTPLPIDAATETMQSEIRSDLSALLLELEKKADAGEANLITATALPLPTGATTEAKQDTIIASLAAIEASNSIEWIGAKQADAGTINIPGNGSATYEIDPSCPNIKAIQSLDTTGYFIALYTGAIGSEILKCVFGPGSDTTMPITIAAGTRLSVRNLDANTIASGKLVLNYIG